MEKVAILKQLQEQCLTLGLQTYGTKQKLRERIENHTRSKEIIGNSDQALNINNEPLINDEDDEGDNGEDGDSTIEDVPIISPFISSIASNENH